MGGLYDGTYKKIPGKLQQAGMGALPFWYVTSQLGQLSLASLRGRYIEYQFWTARVKGKCHLCQVAGDTVVMFTQYVSKVEMLKLVGLGWLGDTQCHGHR